MCHLVEVGVSVSARDELLEEMLSAWAELMTVVKSIGGRFDEDLGDGWRVRDVLAHLALWERVANWKLTGAVVPNSEGLIDREPWDLDAFNVGMRNRWRDRSPSDVLAELRAAHEALVAAVSSSSDSGCAPKGGVWTVIHEDGAGHYEHHLPALQRAAGSGT